MKPHEDGNYDMLCPHGDYVPCPMCIGDLLAQRDKLAEALRKARDTFADMAKVDRMLGRDVMASVAMVAERGCDYALTICGLSETV